MWDTVFTSVCNFQVLCILHLLFWAYLKYILSLYVYSQIKIVVTDFLWS